MKKSELKQILKPLVKECIKECLFEEGVLSGIIKEVAQGLAANTITESSRSQPEAQDLKQKMAEEEYERQRQERIKRLNESASQQFGVDIFEGTKPAAPESNGQGPLAGVSPGDKGVDINGIVGLAKGKWKHLI
mgnify:CR=1 FL=1|tara:strand:- start:1550 stop:1951 length:402 start_codon:yes stop_codon:yes gene_type:complete